MADLPRYSVSLQVISEHRALAELSALLSQQPGPGSHDTGTPRPGGRTWRYSVLRVPAGDRRYASIDESLQSLDAVVRSPRFEGLRSLSDIELIFDVAVFATAYAPTLRLSQEVLTWIVSHGLTLELSIYPTEDSPDAVQSPP
jgi:hypothetical protein